MNYEDIIALAKAGFNSQQIAQIAQDQEAVKEVKTEIPQEPQASDISPKPADAAKTIAAKAPEVTAVTPSADTSKIDAVLQELAQLKTTIQTRNIQASNQPAKESVDDILASIIRPTYNKKEE